MKLRFYGASDDLMIVIKDGILQEEWNCFDRPCALEVYSPGEQKGLIVIGEFRAEGVWQLAATLLEVGNVFPNWNVQICQEHKHSPGLSMECPDDVVITRCDEG